MLEKNLKLGELILASYKSFIDPNNVELADIVNNYIGKIVVIQYLPLKDKENSIFRILNLLQENNKRPDEVNVQLELLFTLEIIHNYTNIEVEPGFYEFFGEDFFDALVATGVLEAVEDICEKDIKRLRHMLDSTINWRNIFDLVDGFSNIDMTHVDALVQEVKTVKDNLKEENLELLKKITDYNQPSNYNFADMINASLINSLDKISDEEIAKWHKKQNLLVDLDSLLGERAYENIVKDINEYFSQHAELGNVDEKEIQNVYEYLKQKNQGAIDKLDYSIAEENRNNIEKGMSAQMIKLLSKKKALERKYKKEEELLRLADTIISMDSANIDDVLEVLDRYQKITEDKKDQKISEDKKEEK